MASYFRLHITVLIITKVSTVRVRSTFFLTSNNNIVTGYNVVDLHCVSRNDTGVAYCNFDAHQPFLVIFGRDVAEKVCYQMVICYRTSSN